MTRTVSGDWSRKQKRDESSTRRSGPVARADVTTVTCIGCWTDRHVVHGDPDPGCPGCGRGRSSSE